MIEMYERMWQLICELPNTPRSMLVLLDAFPEATVEDWWMVFGFFGPTGAASVPPTWWTKP
jgi:hypothetical protein